MSLPQPWECASEVTDIVRTDRQGTPHACPCDGYGEKLLSSNRAAAEPIPLMTPGRKYKVPAGSHVKCVPKASPLSSTTPATSRVLLFLRQRLVEIALFQVPLERRARQLRTRRIHHDRVEWFEARLFVDARFHPGEIGFEITLRDRR